MTFLDFGVHVKLTSSFCAHACYTENLASSDCFSPGRGYGAGRAALDMSDVCRITATLQAAKISLAGNMYGQQQSVQYAGQCQSNGRIQAD